jgi:hypothetical protein
MNKLVLVVCFWILDYFDCSKQSLGGRHSVKKSVLNAECLEALKLVFLTEIHNRNGVKRTQVEVRVGRVVACQG